MDTLTESVVFLLDEYTSVAGAEYARYVTQISDLDEDDALLRSVMKDRREELERKLARAKSFIESLKTVKP